MRLRSELTVEQITEMRRQVLEGQLMQAAKIESKTTYHRLIEDLVSLGYCKYEASYNPATGIFKAYSATSVRVQRNAMHK